jgi:hypothetical protein
MGNTNFSFWKWKKSEILFVLIVLLGTFSISFLQIKIGAMKTRDAQRKADGRLIFGALNLYFDDYGSFPAADSNGHIIQCGRSGQEICEWGQGPIVDADNVPYLRKIPIDPLSEIGNTYIYEVDASRQHVRIYAALEYKGDPEIKEHLTTVCGLRVQCNWYVEN